MGQCIIEIGRVGVPGTNGGRDVFEAMCDTEELTTSGISAATTITAQGGEYACVINNSATAMWVTFAATPTAAVGTTHVIPPNDMRFLGPLTQGHKAAVIDDS